VIEIVGSLMMLRATCSLFLGGVCSCKLIYFVSFKLINLIFRSTIRNKS
jgi:hypothetical protein